MSTAYVTFTVEYQDGTVQFRTLHGGMTIRRLKALGVARFRALANVVHVGAGNGFYRNSYGAH